MAQTIDMASAETALSYFVAQRPIFRGTVILLTDSHSRGQVTAGGGHGCRRGDRFSGLIKFDDSGSGVWVMAANGRISFFSHSNIDRVFPSDDVVTLVAELKREK